ncbi:flagellar biosynthesis anti-sigma factor FlgM [Solibacillus cecembensis]|uniref:flagellar biosynthesis anti-sigma factor FlgM n=1 Tax=Solibacillus cecembensis TaxID=459347 RepID=UPI0007172F1D
MKINPIGIQAINSYKNQERSVNNLKSKQSFADQIEISSKAKEMQGTSAYASERANKVQKLKEEIQSGNYKVDARQVAEDMLKYYRR